jgi:hypothetical protein
MSRGQVSAFAILRDQTWLLHQSPYSASKHSATSCPLSGKTGQYPFAGDVNATDNRGNTALMLAEASPHAEAIAACRYSYLPGHSTRFGLVFAIHNVFYI